MIFIGIDQSLTNTGLSIIKGDESPLLFSIVPKKELNGVRRLDYISFEICRLISQNLTDLVVPDDIYISREDYAYRGTGNVFNLGELGGVIDYVIYKSINSIFVNYENIVYISMPINSWKLLILGNGSVKKDTQYLLKVFDKTGIKFDDDNIADSYMIASAMKKIVCHSFEELSVKEKFGMISSSVRKKNKITEKGISVLSEDYFNEMTKKTMEEYSIFRGVRDYGNQ